MGKVIDFNTIKDNNAPHFTIATLDGNAHIIPVQFFEDVIEGKRKITDLDDFDIIIRSILKEWLEEFDDA